jgi:enamine deaminase RidA (YjgF/YER057c/UK114 family)
MLGMVKAMPDFADRPRVINGCSDLLVDVFGEAGRHSRSVVGVGSLPGNITVEIQRWKVKRSLPFGTELQGLICR